MKQIFRRLIASALVIFFAACPGLSAPLSYVLEVHRSGTVLEREEAVKIIEAGFQALYPEQRYRIEVKALHHWDRMDLPSGSMACELILSEQARRGGNISGLLVFRREKREVGKARFSARVDIYVDVLAAAHYLGRHYHVQAKDVQWASRTLSVLPHDFLMEPREVLGKRMTIGVNRGEVLRAGIVEEPPLLRKGDRVTLVAESHQIKITTTAEVREEGRRGDRIKLVNLLSRKEVTGTVLDEHTVQVDF
jgi:flagella basal body P-ring formation protein FlgA